MPAEHLGPKFVGFWRDPSEPETAGLPNPKDCADPQWDTGERRRVIRYLRSGKEFANYLGYSWCRMDCGIPDNKLGSRDLTDGTYVWPEGFAHYVEKHNVKPPEHFLQHVRSQLASQPPTGLRGMFSRLFGRKAAS